MLKLLIRIVAIILVACLLVDSGFAAAMSNSRAGLLRIYLRNSKANPTEIEALQPELVDSEGHAMVEKSLAPKVHRLTAANWPVLVLGQRLFSSRAPVFSRPDEMGGTGDYVPPNDVGNARQARLLRVIQEFDDFVDQALLMKVLGLTNTNMGDFLHDLKVLLDRNAIEVRPGPQFKAVKNRSTSEDATFSQSLQHLGLSEYGNRVAGVLARNPGTAWQSIDLRRALEPMSSGVRYSESSQQILKLRNAGLIRIVTGSNYSYTWAGESPPHESAAVQQKPFQAKPSTPTNLDLSYLIRDISLRAAQRALPSMRVQRQNQLALILERLGRGEMSPLEAAKAFLALGVDFGFIDEFIHRAYLAILMAIDGPLGEFGQSSYLDAEQWLSKALSRISESMPMKEAVEQIYSRLDESGLWPIIEETFQRDCPSLVSLFGNAQQLLPVLIETRKSLSDIEEQAQRVLHDSEALSLFALERESIPSSELLLPRIALVSPEALASLKRFAEKPDGRCVMAQARFIRAVGVFLANRISRTPTMTFLSAVDPIDLDVPVERTHELNVFWYYLSLVYNTLQLKGDSPEEAGTHVAQWLSDFNRVNTGAQFQPLLADPNFLDWLEENLVKISGKTHATLIGQIADVLRREAAGASMINRATIDLEVQKLRDVSNFKFGRDLERLCSVDGHMKDAGLPAAVHLSLMEELLEIRLTLRTRHPDVIEMEIGFLEWAVADCYARLGNYVEAMRHLTLASGSLQKQRRFLGTRDGSRLMLHSLWPAWYQFSTVVHRSRGEILHALWKKEGKEEDLRNAVKEMKLACDHLSNADKITSGYEERFSVPVELAFYTAESCVYEPSERVDELLGVADRLVTAAEMIVTADHGGHRGLPLYQIPLTRGLIRMARNQTEEAKNALEASWELKHTDMAAVRLMALGVESGSLDDAQGWAEKVSNKEAAYYNYIRGDLESILAEESEGEDQRAHFRAAIGYWEKLPADHRDALILSFGFLPRFHYRMVDSATRAGDAAKAIEHIAHVLANYREGLPAIGRVLVEFFTDPSHYQLLVDHLSVLPEALHAHILIDEVHKTLRKNSPADGTLEEAASQILNQYGENARVERLKNYTKEWERLLERKDFNATLLDQFLIKLRSAVQADMHAELLATWAEDVSNEKPTGKRARLSSSYRLVLRYVQELKWNIQIAHPTLKGLTFLQRVTDDWSEAKRPWISKLMDKEKKYELISDLSLAQKAVKTDLAAAANSTSGPAGSARKIPADAGPGVSVEPMSAGLPEELGKRSPALLPASVFERLPRMLERREVRTYNPPVLRERAYWASLQKKMRDVDINLLAWVLSFPNPELASFSLELDDRDTRTYEGLKKFMRPERIEILNELRATFLIYPNERVPLSRIVRSHDDKFIGMGSQGISPTFFDQASINEQKRIAFEDKPRHEASDWEPLTGALWLIFSLAAKGLLKPGMLDYILSEGRVESFTRTYLRHAQPDDAGNPQGLIRLDGKWQLYDPDKHNPVLIQFHDFVADFMVLHFFLVMSACGDSTTLLSTAVEKSPAICIWAHSLWNQRNFPDGFQGMGSEPPVEIALSSQALMPSRKNQIISELQRVLEPSKLKDLTVTFEDSNETALHLIDGTANQVFLHLHIVRKRSGTDVAMVVFPLKKMKGDIELGPPWCETKEMGLRMYIEMSDIVPTKTLDWLVAKGEEAANKRARTLQSTLKLWGTPEWSHVKTYRRWSLAVSITPGEEGLLTMEQQWPGQSRVFKDGETGIIFMRIGDLSKIPTDLEIHEFLSRPNVAHLFGIADNHRTQHFKKIALPANVNEAAEIFADQYKPSPLAAPTRQIQLRMPSLRSRIKNVEEAA